jgi:aminoglycoside phosphotransferase (APT) family kinase protein
MNGAPNISELADKLLAYLKTELKMETIHYAETLTQLQGGYETHTYRFQLTGVTTYPQPLVLRLYPEFYGSGNAVWESTIQNILADAKYPVARAHWVCREMEVLGGAFFIMDHIPGQLLTHAPMDLVPQLLGETHARLHQFDPQPLQAALHKKGIDPYGYTIESRFDWLVSRVKKHPQLQAAVDWLLANRPPEPDQLAICHGDFHPNNILSADGKITGVLDWPGFAVADPAFDVACTLMLMTIPFKLLLTTMPELQGVNLEDFINYYLTAYESVRPLDRALLDFYQVRRCIFAIFQGLEGQEIWRHPMIVQDVRTFIHKITGILVEIG